MPYLCALEGVAAHNVESGRLKNHLDGFEMSQSQRYVDGRLPMLRLNKTNQVVRPPTNRLDALLKGIGYRPSSSNLYCRPYGMKLVPKKLCYVANSDIEI